MLYSYIFLVKEIAKEKSEIDIFPKTIRIRVRNDSPNHFVKLLD